MLNVAVVGLGWWGRIIVPLLAESRALRVVHTVDANPAAAMAGIPFSTDYDEALRDPAVQGVVLCTPHTLHCGQIVRAASAGKHVFCEKPLSLSRHDVLRAVEACNANRVALAVGHEKRFEPPIQELMRMVKAGELGTPLQVEANFSQDKFLALPADNWRTSGREAPAGPLTATGIHLLDLSVGIFGPAQRAFASVRQLDSQLANGDTLAILVDFGKGHSLISAVLATPFDGRFAVYGSKGWAEVRDKAHPEAPEGWLLTKALRGKRPQTMEFPPAKAVLANLEAFADAAAGRAPYPVTQAEMIANISALEAVVRSAASGKVEPVSSAVWTTAERVA
jgi:predicted dehydrogenase